jgi:hypothetical protein
MHCLEDHPQGLVLRVRAQPGARRAGIVGLHGDMLKVAVTQAAEKGRANAALRQVLCEELNLRGSQLELLSGETARAKRFLIRGAQRAALECRIDAIVGRGGETS